MDKLKVGTPRGDGKVFRRYLTKDGKTYESWTTPEMLEKEAIANRARNLGRSRKPPSTEEARAANRQIDNARQKRWRLANLEKARQRRRDWLRANPIQKIGQVARVRVWAAIRSIKEGKTKPTINYLGCDPEALVSHLESLFQEGMTLSNYGQWHVDHIIPIASASTLEELIPLLHYTNLQPLWAHTNQSKGCKL